MNLSVNFIILQYYCNLIYYRVFFPQKIGASLAKTLVARDGETLVSVYADCNSLYVSYVLDIYHMGYISLFDAIWQYG